MEKRYFHSHFYSFHTTLCKLNFISMQLARYPTRSSLLYTDPNPLYCSTTSLTSNLASMASFSIGAHLPQSHHQFKKRPLLFFSQTQCLAPSQPCFGSSLRGLRGSRFLGNGMLARAEEKARGSGSGQQPKAQSKSEKELQVLFD